MSVIALCVSTSKGGDMHSVQEISVEAGAGIVGDRYFGPQRHPGQNITLIEAEEVEAFNARTGKLLGLTDPRRNVVTRGVRLNGLVGREFRIGSARLRGVELCEPCGTLAGYLAGDAMSRRTFVREFAHRCGLRADVVESGRFGIGDAVELLDAGGSGQSPASSRYPTPGSVIRNRGRAGSGSSFCRSILM